MRENLNMLMTKLKGPRPQVTLSHRHWVKMPPIPSRNSDLFNDGSG
jgi:hypothetical protein